MDGGVHTKIVTRNGGDRVEVHNHIRRSYGDQNQEQYVSDQQKPISIQYYEWSGWDDKLERQNDLTIKNRPGTPNEEISYGGHR